MESSRIDVDVSAGWLARSKELAQWAWDHLVNRSDVWGGYLPRARRTGKDFTVTKPATKKRDAIQLSLEVLQRHFAGQGEGDICGLHTTSIENTSRWIGIDIDSHDGDADADPARNAKAAIFWFDKLVSMGLTPLLTESNGNGGFHILVILLAPVPTAWAFAFARDVVSDFGAFGFARAPECFPRQAEVAPGKFGNWMRLPGRHHTRDHWSRVYDPVTAQWIDGEEAITAILTYTGDSADLVPEPAQVKKPTPRRESKPRRAVSGKEDDRDVARRCLDHIPNGDLDYDTWLNVGMALHHAGCELTDWAVWSQQSNKHEPATCAKKWASFGIGGGGRVTIASLIKMARDNGYEPYPRSQRAAPRSPARTTDEDMGEAAVGEYESEEPPYEPPAEAAGLSNPEPIYTEYSNAQKLVARYGEKVRYCPEWGKFLVYDGKRWKKDETGVLSRCAKRVARALWDDLQHAGEIGVDYKALLKHILKSESSQGITAMLKLVQSEPNIPVQSDQWDADHWRINTKRGTVQLRTGEVDPHDPIHLITKMAPVYYDPDATCPLWDSFLNRIMDGNEALIAYLGRIFGLCLTGDISVQELFVFHGGGANGKNVLMDTWSGIMGEYAGAAPPGLLTTRTHEEHPTEIADLQGKRLVFASETEENARLRIQLVKRMTGDPTLKGRFMRQDYFEFPRTHKTILITNNKPVIREGTNAVWRRIRLVPFNVTIPEPERDPLLTAKLMVEWPGILAWGIRGGLEWQHSGMQPPEEVLMATKGYQDEQDPLSEYVADRCVMLGGAKVIRNELFNDYAAYCHQTAEKYPLGKQEFYGRIRALKGVSEDAWRPAGTTVVGRGFRGIGLAFLRMNTGEEEAV